MKRTQLKDALRNIWKQKVSYLSVIVIAFLGVATFLGINYSDGALRKNGSTMYNAVNYRDLEIMSTNVFYQEDLDAILGVEGVKDAEPVWQTAAKATAGDRRQDISVISMTERVNRPQLIEGHMPQTAQECVVEQRLAQNMGWSMGDAVMAQNAKGEAATFLKNNRFTVVGIANHPDHTSVSIPDTLYVMVEKTAFDMEQLNNGFMKVEIVVDKPEGIDRFSKGYEAIVDAVSQRMEAVGDSRAAIRDREVRSQTQSQLDEAQAKLDEAHETLQKGREELDEGWSQLEEGNKQISENEAKLIDGQGQLMTAQTELMAGRDKLAEGEIKLAQAEVELSMGSSVLNVGREQLDRTRKALIDSWNMKEDAVESLRNSLRDALGSAGEDIHWSSRRSVNIDSSNVTAMKIDIADSLKFDLKKSLKTNIRALLDSGLISDEAMIVLYIGLTGGGS